MALVLSLISDSKYFSASILKETNVVESIVLKDANLRISDFLPSVVDSLFYKSNILKEDVDIIAFSFSPGSFTNTRVCCVFSLGFCFSLNKKLLAFNTLEAMANYWQDKTNTTNVASYIEDRNHNGYTFIDENTRKMNRENFIRYVNKNKIKAVACEDNIFNEHDFKNATIIKTNPTSEYIRFYIDKKLRNCDFSDIYNYRVGYFDDSIV